jgi:protein tyrosine/serine phosphatase
VFSNAALALAARGQRGKIDAAMARDLSFSGIDNFRDFGGFATADGGRVRRGLLLRSAHLGAATDQDLARLDAVPVTVIVDLRRPSERERDPSRRSAGFRGQLIESDDDGGQAPHLEFLRAGDLSPEAVEAFLLGYYRQAPFLDRHRDLFARAFAALDRAEGAMLIHCAAGKDRTGLLAAMIRTALGGRFDETVADYEATNQAMITPDRIVLAREKLQAILGRPPPEMIVNGFLGVWGRHLAAAFAEIEARCGSIEQYLDGLGGDAARRGRIARRLVG